MFWTGQLDRFLHSDTVIGFVSICFLATFLLHKRRKSRLLPLPPGPRKLPIVGNVFHIPTSFEWEVYSKWSKEYNTDIIHLDAAGVSIVILDTVKVAAELLEKRSAIYSSRPISVMFHELLDCGTLFGTMPYGEAWREHRKLFQQHFHPSNIKIVQTCELEFRQKLLLRLLHSPAQFMEHARFFVGAVIVTLAYGLEIQDNNDPYLANAEKAMVGLAMSVIPGAFLVDLIPILKYVPSWMPGAGFQRKARVWRSQVYDMMEKPFRDAQRAIAEGKAKPSFVSMCLASMDETSDMDHQLRVIRNTAANFFTGGADTSVAVINNFMLAMTCHPDVQRKAQEELDRVVTKGQLPSFEDEASLPYLSAVVKEVIRCGSVTPMAAPRSITEDDEYNGYFIPKGSVVLANAWSMLHNEEEYPEPFEFKPERFLKDGKLNPDVRDPSATFGFGRRVCPGSHIALSTIWLAAASILAVYDISPVKDSNGNPLMPPQEYIPSIILHPAPFQCSIRPRSKDAEQLIRLLDE